MLPTKRARLKTKALLSILWMCFCLTVVITTGHSSNEANPKDSEAQQALAHAESLRARWTKASFRQAIEQYDKAALIWISVSDFSNASEATLKSGDIYFLLSEYPKALERFQSAESLARKTGDWLRQGRAQSQIGRVQSYLGNNDQAETQLRQALDLLKRHEANRTVERANAYGEALSNLAEVSYAKGEFLNSLLQLDDALKRFQNNPKGEAKARLFKGYVTGTIGESDKAFAEISRALDLSREIDDKSGEGLALTAMGLWHSSEKIESQAIELHKQAGEIFRAIEDQHSEAISLNGIGQAYENLGDYSEALNYYQRALGLFEKIGALDSATGITCGIAETQHRAENFDQALAFFERCLKLSRSAQKQRIEAWALSGIATVYGAQNRREQGLKQHQIIRKFFKGIKDLRGEAMALNAQGDFFLRIGEKEKALDVYRQAFSLSEQMGDKAILISALYNLARANYSLGSYEEALSLIKRSFSLIDEIRTNVGSPFFRASYFSGVKKHYDLCIEILMQLHRLRPDGNFASAAFLISEQSRASLLLELLSESREKNIRDGAAKELLDSERRLKGLLRLEAQRQIALSSSGKDSDLISDLRSQYQVVQAKLREQNPRLFAFEQFASVNLESVQKELRDNNTMLLEYALGDEHSYLWAITSASVQTYELPARKVIEGSAFEFYKLITSRQVEATDVRFLEEAGKLGQFLLGPVGERLGSQRLVVVTEGALQYIPFDVLQVPTMQTDGPGSSSKKFLGETNEIVVLPSASTLSAIRRAQTDKASVEKLVAVIADPVFSRTDDRVQGDTLSSAIANASTNQHPDQFGQPIFENLRLARLPHASEEASAISSVAPWGTTLLASGFDASRETVMSSEISKAQIIHFATHGFLDSKRPELSAMVLSMMDRNGERMDGLMPLPDIYSLDLSADLVVLSACETALGKELKGEGLVGLTHSFMSAGAKSVVASLWKVDDRATAVLMADFYEGMLKHGMTPSAALRSAKLKMMRDKQWSAPYYWAGFVLQGEYAHPITVEQHSWRKFGVVLLVSLILILAALLVILKRKRRTLTELT